MEKIPKRRLGSSKQTLEIVVSSANFINVFLFTCAQIKVLCGCINGLYRCQGGTASGSRKEDHQEFGNRAQR